MIEEITEWAFAIAFVAVYFFVPLFILIWYQTKYQGRLTAKQVNDSSVYYLAWFCFSSVTYVQLIEYLRECLGMAY